MLALSIWVSGGVLFTTYLYRISGFFVYSILMSTAVCPASAAIRFIEVWRAIPEISNDVVMDTT
jgi:hypothetical protein